MSSWPPRCADPARRPARTQIAPPVGRFVNLTRRCGNGSASRGLRNPAQQLDTGGRRLRWSRCNPHPSAHDRYRYRQRTSTRYCRSQALAPGRVPVLPVPVLPNWQPRLDRRSRSRSFSWRLTVQGVTAPFSGAPCGPQVGLTRYSGVLSPRLSPQIDQEARVALNPIVGCVHISMFCTSLPAKSPVMVSRGHSRTSHLRR
jgi:hypothetical protein